MENQTPFEITPEIVERLQKLHQKYQPLGQDMVSYLDGLYYANQTTYWDYLKIDTLLSLQTPKTPFPDEQIFILYHQITELYFKLIQLELDQLGFDDGTVTPDNLLMRLGRINNYYFQLTQSFSIMYSCMDPKQFLQFRMALLPASGFQSAQFREIEFRLTGLHQLVHRSVAGEFSPDASTESLYEKVYWKFGNRDEKTGEKTLTLKMFEERYDQHFLDLARKNVKINLLDGVRNLSDEIDPRLRKELRSLDEVININWRYAHYHSVKVYMEKTENAPKTETGLRTYEDQPETVRSTGGTNWKKYLPPNAQKIVFFPDVWTPQELANWGEKV